MEPPFMRHGFAFGETYAARVSRVKDDRVFFRIFNDYDESFEAVYYVHGERINLHQVFKIGEKVDVIAVGSTNSDIIRKKVKRQMEDVNRELLIHFPEVTLDSDLLTNEVFYKNPSFNVQIEVKPLLLPVDEFIKENPVGSKVKGTIEKIIGKKVFIKLAQNVVGVARLCSCDHNGKEVYCTVASYKKNRHQLNLKLV